MYDGGRACDATKTADFALLFLMAVQDTSGEEKQERRLWGDLSLFCLRQQSAQGMLTQFFPRRLKMCLSVGLLELWRRNVCGSWPLTRVLAGAGRARPEGARSIKEGGGREENSRACQEGAGHKLQRAVQTFVSEGALCVAPDSVKNTHGNRHICIKKNALVPMMLPGWRCATFHCV